VIPKRKENVKKATESEGEGNNGTEYNIRMASDEET